MNMLMKDLEHDKILYHFAVPFFVRPPMPQKLITQIPFTPYNPCCSELIRIISPGTNAVIIIKTLHPT